MKLKTLKYFTFSLVLAQCLLSCLAQEKTSQILQKLQEYNCSEDSVKIRGEQVSCQCVDDTTCIFTIQNAISGCPCVQNQALQKRKFKCIEKARQFKCDFESIDCTQQFGNCACAEGGKCFWNEGSVLGGCPCGGVGRKHKFKVPGIKVTDL